MAALKALGARSVPVVSKGDKFVFAQVIKDVVDFLGLNEETGPVLSPAQLAERYQDILGRAVSLVAQMPDECLSTRVAEPTALVAGVAASRVSDSARVHRRARVGYRDGVRDDGRATAGGHAAQC